MIMTEGNYKFLKEEYDYWNYDYDEAKKYQEEHKELKPSAVLLHLHPDYCTKVFHIMEQFGAG